MEGDKNSCHLINIQLVAVSVATPSSPGGGVNPSFLSAILRAATLSPETRFEVKPFLRLTLLPPAVLLKADSILSFLLELSRPLGVSARV